MKTVHVRIPHGIHAKIRTLSEGHQLSINMIVRICLTWASNRKMLAPESVVRMKKEYMTTFGKRGKSEMLKIELEGWMPVDSAVIRAVIWRRIKDEPDPEPVEPQIHPSDQKYIKLMEATG